MIQQPLHAGRFPNAIWMPTPASPTLPSCYQGSPLEMVKAMADEMKPGLSPHEAIDHLLSTLADSRRVRIRLPEGSDEFRAQSFVAALLVSGIARPMASA